LGGNGNSLLPLLPILVDAKKTKKEGEKEKID
jgi:hypothetical protein